MENYSVTNSAKRTRWPVAGFGEWPNRFPGGTMPAYAPENKVGTKMLGPGQSLELKFPVSNRGQVQVIAAAVLGTGPMPANGIKRKVELFAPGQATAAAVKEESGLAFVTMLVHDAEPGEGEWTARVTNLDTHSMHFRLQCAYPGTTRLKVNVASSGLVDSFINNTLGQLHVRLTRGENASYVEFPSELNVPDQRFTVQDLRRAVSLMLVRIQMVEFPNDINSSSILFSMQNASSAHPNGSIRLQIAFEETGRELLGSFQVQLSHMLLTVDLDLDVESRKLTYDGVDVAASFDVNIVGLPDGVLNAIFHYEEYLETLVAGEVRRAFSRPDVRAAISDAMMTSLTPVLGEDAEVASVKVEDNRLTVETYASRKRVAA